MKPYVDSSINVACTFEGQAMGGLTPKDKVQYRFYVTLNMVTCMYAKQGTSVSYQSVFVVRHATTIFVFSFLLFLVSGSKQATLKWSG